MLDAIISIARTPLLFLLEFIGVNTADLDDRLVNLLLLLVTTFFLFVPTLAKLAYRSIQPVRRAISQIAWYEGHWLERGDTPKGHFITVVHFRRSFIRDEYVIEGVALSSDLNIYADFRSRHVDVDTKRNKNKISFLYDGMVHSTNDEFIGYAEYAFSIGDKKKASGRYCDVIDAAGNTVKSVTMMTINLQKISFFEWIKKSFLKKPHLPNRRWQQQLAALAIRHTPPGEFDALQH